MDMDAYKVKEVIGNNPRFVSPFCEPCSYYIWKKHDETVRNEEIEIYWRKLKYMSDNIDRFIQQAFHPPSVPSDCSINNLYNVQT